MIVFNVRIEVASSLWWQESGLGLAFGPEGPEGPFQPLGSGSGPEGPKGPKGPSSPLNWMLVFCVRIEVVNSVS